MQKFLREHDYFKLQKNSYRCCCVPNCQSMNRNGVSLFRIPREEQEKKRRRKWLRLLRLGRPPTKTMRVCSKHFTEQDLIPATIGRPRPLLKRIAVPSQNLPKVIRQYDENSSRAVRTAARAARIAEGSQERPPVQTTFVAVDETEVLANEVEFKEVACQTDDICEAVTWRVSGSKSEAACQVG